MMVFISGSSLLFTRSLSSSYNFLDRLAELISTCAENNATFKYYPFDTIQEDILNVFRHHSVWNQESAWLFMKSRKWDAIFKKAEKIDQKFLKLARGWIQKCMETVSPKDQIEGTY